jgi:hypothetical protein
VKSKNSDPDFVAARRQKGIRKLPSNPSTTDHADGTDKPISIRVIRAIRDERVLWLRLCRARIDALFCGETAFGFIPMQRA